MKYIPLVWRNLMRRKFRTGFTLGCIFVSFVLYSFLMIVNGAFTLGVDFAGQNRLWVINKVSIIQFIPVAYRADIVKTPGVADAVPLTWFGGSYQEKPNQFATWATEFDRYLAIYPEFKVPPEQMKAAMEDRQACIIGRDTATRYGWKVGDRIPIQADIWLPKDGNTWYFNVAGIYDAPKEADKTQFLMRYDYFDENRRTGKGNVSVFVVKLSSPDGAADVAGRLDAQFANSASETKTQPEQAMISDFANQTGNITGMITAILIVVFFTILLVVANTMAQSVRERTSELAVLKTLGFSDTTVLALVLSESLVIAILGGFAGLGFIYLAVGHGSFNMAMLPVFIFTGRALAIGAALAIGLGFVAGLPPALGAMRLRITDALRRN